MTTPFSALRNGDVLVYVGNTVVTGNTSTTTFATVPTLINKSLTVDANIDYVTDKVPQDADNPTGPSQVISAVDSITHGLSGSATVHSPTHRNWVQWRDSGQAKIVRYGLPGANGYYYEGPMLLEYSFGGDIKNVSEATVKLTATAVMTRVDNGITSASTVTSV
jgi:hypothetical protein